MKLAVGPVFLPLGHLGSQEVHCLYKGHRDAIRADVLPIVIWVGTFAYFLEARFPLLHIDTLHYVLEGVHKVHIV